MNKLSKIEELSLKLNQMILEEPIVQEFKKYERLIDNNEQLKDQEQEIKDLQTKLKRLQRLQRATGLTCVQQRISP